MCWNPIDAIVKVFKKVVRVVKKIAPVVLAVAAVVWTAGAALGVGSMAGGWGAAIKGLGLGGTGVLGKVLTGAVIQAGYGAAAGAGISLLTGGDPLKGAQSGALGGAVSGGLMGGLGWEVDPFKGIGTKAGTAPGTTAGTAAGKAGQVQLPANTSSAGYFPGATSSVPGQAPLAANVGGTGLAGGGAPATTPSTGFAGWLERHQPLVGHTLSGLAQGGATALLAGDAGDGRAESTRIETDAERAERDRETASYAFATEPTNRGLLTASSLNFLTNGPTRQTPAERFDTAAVGGRYEYDPQKHKIVWLPNNQAVA